jgi:MFS family permease
MLPKMSYTSKYFNRELVSVISVVSLMVMTMAILQPVLPLYLKSIGIEPSLLGLMFAVGMAGMVFGESAAGWLADKVGIKIPLSIGTLGCILPLLLFSSTQNIPFLFTIFLVWGVIRSAIFGPGRGYIGTNISYSQKATYMAIYAAAMSIAGSIGSFIGGLTSDHLGYQWSFYIAAGVALLSSGLMVWGLRKIPWGRPQIPISGTHQNTGTLKKLFRSRVFLAQSGVALLCWASTGIIMPFLPLLVTDVTSVTATDIGVLFTVSSLVNAALLIPMGRLSDRTNRKYLMFAGLLVSSAGLAGLALAQNLALFFVAIIIQSIGRAIFSPAAVALLSDTVPANQQNTAMGLYGSCEDLGVVIGSALAGVVWSEVSPQGAFWLVGVMPGIIGALMALTLPLRKANKQVDATENGIE